MAAKHGNAPYVSVMKRRVLVVFAIATVVGLIAASQLFLGTIVGNPRIPSATP